MLEMVREAEALSAQEVAQVVSDMRSQWTILKPCADSVLEKGARYALALAKRVRERGYDAITLIDVDGMKKLPAFRLRLYLCWSAFAGFAPRRKTM